MNDEISVERQNTTLIITFNRPDVRNALTMNAMRRFAQVVDEFAPAGDIHAVIVTGAGELAFCAGGDLQNLHHRTTAEQGAEVGKVMGDALRALEELPVPVIGAINGYALGGGSEIALACDIRIVDEAVKFGLVHKNLALIPGWGGGQRLLRMVGYSKAMEMLLTGEIISAEAMQQLGLANSVVAPGTALTEAVKFTERFADTSLDVVRAIKQIMQAGVKLPYDEALLAERNPFPALWAAPPHLDAVEKFLNRKKSQK